MEANKKTSDQEFVTPYLRTNAGYDEELCFVIKPELSNDTLLLEKKLVKRLDYIYVMPCVSMLLAIQFLDKSALNYSAVLGIRDDVNLDDTQFGWIGSIFFIGYLLYQFPNAYFIQKLNLGKYLGAVTIIWGTVLALTSLSKDFVHLAIFRFLLGVFEAAVFPCAAMLICKVYRRKEQVARIGVIYISGGIALSIGGIMSYGIGHMDNVAGVKAWQWIMIILGCFTVTFGVICFFLLIDDPKQIAKSGIERLIIEHRMKDNAVVVTRKINYKQIIEALHESRFYCFAGFSFLVSLQNGALSVFSSIITKGFGYSNLNAILLSIPSGIMDCFFILVAIVCQRRYNNSIIYIASSMLLVATLGLSLLLVIPLPEAKLVGLYLCYAYVSSVIMVASSIANNVSGYTKKIFYNCASIFFSTIGNFVGPQLMVSSQKPLYIGGMLTYIVSNLLSIVLLLVARYFMSRSNKRRTKSTRLGSTTTDVSDCPLDITDREDSQFIYTL